MRESVVIVVVVLLAPLAARAQQRNALSPEGVNVVIVVVARLVRHAQRVLLGVALKFHISSRLVNEKLTTITHKNVPIYKGKFMQQNVIDIEKLLLEEERIRFQLVDLLQSNYGHHKDYRAFIEKFRPLSDQLDHIVAEIVRLEG